MGKNIYIGGQGSYTTQISITYENIRNYFSVQNSMYYFRSVGGGEFQANNHSVNGTAFTTLVALQDISDVYFNYFCPTGTQNEFTLIFANSTVEGSTSGTTTVKSYAGSLNAGDKIVFEYYNDGSTDGACYFRDMLITVVPSNVARKVKQPYIGVNNVARNITNGYIGVDGVARIFFESVPVWRKYSCSTSTYYVQEYPGTTSYISRSVSQGGGLRYYYNYSFDRYGGFSSSSYSTTSPITQGETDQYQISNEIEGYYDVGTTAVYRYKNVDSMTYYANGSVQLSIRATLVTKAQQATQYYRGGVSYGTVTATEDEMQSFGTIIEGSYADGYYVIQEGSTYYYYVLGG